ncbi:MAG: PilN domain-containing protein [Pseudomonadota bacterium]
MTQQINLHHDGLRTQRQRWRAVHGLWMAGGVLLAGWALASALDAVSARRAAQAQALVQQAAAERAQLVAKTAQAAPAGAQAELERLRAHDAAQRRVQAALAAQAAGRVEGYTPYFLALSRQAQPALWITGFSVGADGQALEIQGRMTDAAVLPAYLRRLNGEAQFKGRSFAQLNLRTPEPREDAPAAFTEFLLRSQAAGAEAAR